MIKRIAQLLLITLSLVSVNSYIFADDSFIISGNPYAPPVVWQEQNGLSGVAPDLINDIFNDLSISYSTRIISDWEKVQQAAQAGEIDLIVSAYRNDERSTYLNFSTPYLPEPTVIVVEKGKEFSFSGWNSLKGKEGVSGIGESYGQKFDAFVKDNLDVGYHPLERTFQLLNLGQADYLIIDLYTALIYARLLRGEDSITILDPPVTTENFHIAIQKNSPLNNHLEAINQKLREKIASGEVKNLLLKHFDNWKAKVEKQSQYLSKFNKQLSAEQSQYLKKQDELARQTIIKTMTDREGLPAAAQ